MEAFYEKKIMELDKMHLSKVELNILTENDESYNKTIAPDKMIQYQNAIINNSKPYPLNGKKTNVRIGVFPIGQIIFITNKKKINIDICDERFFWNGQRTLKNAFISKKLVELIIEDLEGVDGVEGIIRTLQKQTLFYDSTNHNPQTP